MNIAAPSVVTTVLIVDDHPAVREALADRINRSPDLAVFGEAESVEQALGLLADGTPDVAVVDISLKDGNGIDLIRRMKNQGTQTKILVWSMYESQLYADRVLRAGASGYITKEHATERIITAIQEVRDGNILGIMPLTNHAFRVAN